MSRAAFCDLILHNGSYHQRIPRGEVDGIYTQAATPGSGQVKHCLPLSGIYRAPLLGHILRNMWAKKHGAILFAH